MACVRTSSRACTQISDRHSRVLEEVLAVGGVPTLPGRTMDTREAVACGEVWGVLGRS